MLLVAASVVCLALSISRLLYTETTHFLFLIWNLFLAWIPFGASLLAYELHRRREAGLAILLGVGLFWLLFFPNAPYIVSDFVHLRHHGGLGPNEFWFWYDLVMIACFAWTGLLLGLVSLYLMQSIVRERAGRWFSWLFVGGALFAGGFGVYLGRFQRWNSWDLLHRPLALVADIAEKILHPFAHSRTWALTLLFAGMMAMLYFVLYGIVQNSKESAEQSGEQSRFRITEG